MAEALRDAYEDLFHINERPTNADREAIEGKFKSVHNATDRIPAEQTKTFFALLKLADLDAAGKSKSKKKVEDHEDLHEQKGPKKERTGSAGELPFGGLRYNVEIHLPATKDVEVYNAIFKSLKEHLFED